VLALAVYDLDSALVNEGSNKASYFLTETEKVCDQKVSCRDYHSFASVCHHLLAREQTSFRSAGRGESGGETTWFAMAMRGLTQQQGCARRSSSFCFRRGSNQGEI